HTRLVLYKRIASSRSADELRELQVEMIDRFGLLPEQAGFLMGVTQLKLKANPMGIIKLEAGPSGGRIVFQGEPKIDPSHLIGLIQTRPQEFKLDGADKLRFFREMPDRSRRINQVSSLLDEISGR
ncbi:MAG: transcription-repair coupling factor, partial [Gammaproteobacteria bacterium]